MNKFEIGRHALAAIPDEAGNTVLDVGCRDCVFSRHLPEGWSYKGLDLYQNKDNGVTYVQSVEQGIPAPDRAFAGVVALDVVEHVDKISQVMDELWRVTDRKLIVALPNMAFAFHRLQFLFTGVLGEKYKILPYGCDDGDRHRWLTTANDSIRFMQEFVASKDEGATLLWQATGESAKRRLFARVMKSVGISPQFYAPTLVFIVERKPVVRPSG